MAEAPEIELQDLGERAEEENEEEKEETNVDDQGDFVTDALGIDTSEPPPLPYNPELNADHVKLALGQEEVLRE